MEVISSNEKITNFSDMNYLKIKQFVDHIKEGYKSFNVHEDELFRVAEILGSDKRKNVHDLSLKTLKFIEGFRSEINRVKAMYNFDTQFIRSGYMAGVDEVGRGPLAGPIVAASVILNLNVLSNKDIILGIKDSKKLSIKHREELSEIIKSKALCYNIAELDNKVIDARGIAWCNNMVLKRAAEGLSTVPDFVVSDGYPIKGIDLKNSYVIKGDEKSASIACASIIAKVYRDSLMKEYAEKYPSYGFEENAGYGTKDHVEAIKKFGPCPIHRRCFLGNIIGDIKD